MKSFWRSFMATALLVGCVAAGCTNDKAMPGSDDMRAANADLSPACVSQPMTHVEIINACTDAEPFDKAPVYPTLAPGGALPALP